MKHAVLPDVSQEYYRILQLILETPRAGREETERYHSQIKQSLDSGEVISIPSPEHRLLHQIMWITGHEIYNRFIDFNEAVRHFVSGDNGRKDSETEEQRFRKWYVEIYILDEKTHKEREEPPDNNWIYSLRIGAGV